MRRSSYLIVCVCGMMTMSCSSSPTSSLNQQRTQQSAIISVEATRCNPSTAQTTKHSEQKSSCAESRPWWKPTLQAVESMAAARRSHQYSSSLPSLLAAIVAKLEQSHRVRSVLISAPGPIEAGVFNIPYPPSCMAFASLRSRSI